MINNRRIRNLITNRFLISCFLLALVIVVELVVLVKRTPPSNDLAIYAQQIVDKCSVTNGKNSFCYDENIPKLMDPPINLSMEDAFKLTFLVQEQDRNFRYCHVLGHKLSAKEIDKDPSKWKDVVSRCPSGMCSNGCIHGGFQQRFRAESFTDEQIEAIKEDLDTLCEKRGNWNPTRLEQASCYHALGHLTMYLTSADIDKSIKLCEELAVKEDGRDLSQFCFDGSFMQIFQPLEPEDFALIKGKEVARDKIDSFCSKYSGTKRGSCMSESWPLFRQELVSDPKNLVWFCSRQEPSQKDRCYSALFYVLTAQFQFNLERIKNYCIGLPKERQGQCFANAASRLIETDYRNSKAAVDLCNEAQKLNLAESCFEELVNYSTYNYHKGSEDSRNLCASLPNTWNEKCYQNLEK